MIEFNQTVLIAIIVAITAISGGLMWWSSRPRTKAHRPS